MAIKMVQKVADEAHEIKANTLNLEIRVNLLEIDIAQIKQALGIDLYHKNPKAWEKLEVLGKKISKLWKSKKSSWQIISESRR